MVYDELNFKIAAHCITKLYELLLKKRKERQEEINYISDFFGDPIELAMYYQEPDCQQFNPADDTKYDGNVIRHPVFNYLEDVFLSGNKPGGDGKNQLFVLSDAGMGKTSLLVILKLTQITSFWPKGYDCSLLKLGPSTIDDIRKIDGRQHHVLLLDALDEDPMSWSENLKRIKDILNETETFYRVIITCRTQFFTAKDDPFNRRGQVEVADYLCPVIFLSLFTDRQVKDYLKKRFKIKYKQKSAEKVAAVLSIINKMGSLRCRPMLLSHAEDLLESNDVIWSEYNVYEALVRVWLHRERRKKIWKDIGDPPTIEMLLSICKHVAEALQRTQKLSLDESMLKNLISSHPEAMFLELIDVEGRSLLNKDSEGKFRFSHYSIQEFLLVKGIVDGDFKDRSSIRATNQILRFALSWISEDSKKRNLFRWNILEYREISFAGFNLSYLDFRGSDLRGLNFNDVNFSGTDLRNTDIRGTNFERSTFDDVKLDRAIIDEHTKFPLGLEVPASVLRIEPKTRLNGVDLSGIDLSGVDLSGSVMTELILDGANIKQANLKNVEMHDVSLKNSDVSNSNFNGSQIGNVSLYNANLRGSKFRKAQLNKIDFSASNMRECDFSEANINEVDFCECNLRDSNFYSAKGKKISFKDSMLINVRFVSSELEDCNMDTAEFYDENEFVSRR